MNTNLSSTSSNKLKKFLYLVLVFVVAGVSALGGAVVGGYVVSRNLSQQFAVEQTASVPAALPQQSQRLEVSSTQIDTAITQTVESVGPAVVTIEGTITGQVTFFGRAIDQQVSGSGVIISPDGYILTNNHVVEGATDLVVILSDGTEIPAEVISLDEFSDLAVIQAEGNMPAVAMLGNSDQIKPGETVIAIGSPLGTFKNSVTVGVVSATGRVLDTGSGYQMEDLIQTDAAINQGNSGGPLVNLAGEVVGINVAIVRSSGSSVAEGLGFAIPANTARIIAEQMIENGYFARPYLGIRWQAITPAIAQRYGLPVEWGVYIMDVSKGSPAELGGLQKGDILTQIGDRTIDEQNSFANALFAYQPGQVVEIKVVRDNLELEIPVTLGEMGLE